MAKSYEDKIILPLTYAGAGEFHYVFDRDLPLNGGINYDYLGSAIDQDFNGLMVINENMAPTTLCRYTTVVSGSVNPVTLVNGVTQVSIGMSMSESSVVIKRIRIYLAAAGSIQLILFL